MTRPHLNVVVPSAAIYKITNDATSDVYVGSTIRGVVRRMRDHVLESHRGPSPHPLNSLMRKWGSGRFQVTTLETFRNISKPDLLIEEGRWVLKLATLNRIVPGKMSEHKRNGTLYLMSMD